MIKVQFVLFCVGLPRIVLPYLIEPLPGSHVVVGDAPHWRHPNLYYADLGSGKVARYDSEENRTYQCQIPGENRVSYIIPYRGTNNKFSVGLGKLAAKLQWNGGSKDCNIVEHLFDIAPEEPIDANNCLNDGKCDARGRLYTGTASCLLDWTRLRQNLYRYANASIEPVHRSMNMSNGMAWDEEREAFYIVDSGAHTITKFNYNMMSGRLTKPRVVFTLNVNEFPPNDAGLIIMDGLTVDSDGYLYVTILGGGSVLKISPSTWNIVKRYKMPCAFVSSAIFGGPRLDELYVTSASALAPSVTFPAPCGSTFRLRGLSARGVEMREAL